MYFTYSLQVYHYHFGIHPQCHGSWAPMLKYLMPYHVGVHWNLYDVLGILHQCRMTSTLGRIGKVDGPKRLKPDIIEYLLPCRYQPLNGLARQISSKNISTLKWICFYTLFFQMGLFPSNYISMRQYFF